MVSENNLSFFAGGNPFPDLLTEEELIEFLRISQVSTAKDYHTVIENLIRFKDLPRIQLCKRLLFPKKAVLEWIEKQTVRN
ncbi:MAG: helix-turn-helix domain-containing protein [Sedimentisphaerales bacterium]